MFKNYLLVFRNNHDIRSVDIGTQLFVPVTLDEVVFLMVKQDIHTGIYGRPISSFVNQKRGPVLFLYPPDVHEPDAGTAGIRMGGMSGKSQVL